MQPGSRCASCWHHQRAPHGTVHGQALLQRLALADTHAVVEQAARPRRASALGMYTSSAMLTRMRLCLFPALPLQWRVV